MKTKITQKTKCDTEGKTVCTIGLDLGTCFGWCVFKEKKIKASGWQNLQNDTLGVCVADWEQQILKLLKDWRAEKQIICFELVARHVSTYSAQKYGAFLGVLSLVCHKQQIPLFPLPVTLIKRRFTSHGHASKQLVLDTVKLLLPNYKEVTNHNEADAIAINWVFNGDYLE